MLITRYKFRDFAHTHPHPPTSQTPPTSSPPPSNPPPSPAHLLIQVTLFRLFIFFIQWVGGWEGEGGWPQSGGDNELRIRALRAIPESGSRLGPSRVTGIALSLCRQHYRIGI